MTLRKWRPIWRTLEKESRRIDGRLRALEKEQERRLQRQKSRKLSAELTLRHNRRWFCNRCGEWHLAGECPRELEYAVSYIERRLARSVGLDGADDILRNIAEYILFDCGDDALRERYRNHPQLGEYIDLVEGESRPGIGHNAPPKELSDAQAKLVRDHITLAYKIARQYAKNSPQWRDELRTHLIDKMCELVHQYDKSQGVTFGAFIKLRLMGAARDWIKRQPRTFNIDPNTVDVVIRDKTRKSPHPASDKRPDSWVTTPTLRFGHGGSENRRPPPTLTDDLNAALANMKPREAAVYRGRILNNPPVSVDQLARELRVHRKYIPRLLRRAQRKINEMVQRKKVT